MSRIIYSALATSLVLSSTYCFADLAEEPGFDFIININAGVAKGNSQRNTNKDNEVTQDLNNGGKEMSGPTLLVLGRLSYTLDSNKTQFFFGNSEENVALGDFKTELGIRHEFSNGMVLTGAYNPFLFTSKEWQDPFITNEKRQTTDVESEGARLRIDNLFSLPLAAEYIWTQTDFENDLSGQQLNSAEQKLLQRDMTLHQLYLEYTQPLSERFAIEPAVTLTRGDSEGDAMSFDQSQLQTALVSQLTERSQLITTVYLGHASYDKSHPIFNKLRKDDQYGAFAFYSYARPFNWENSTFTAMLEYGENDSNIDFYDAEIIAASVGLAYKF
jgi:hypothetical protein